LRRKADGTVRVHGIATTEAVDDQGEIVRADAMRAALPDYMRFPAIREMHQLSAAGTALEADVGDDNCLRIAGFALGHAAANRKSAVDLIFHLGDGHRVDDVREVWLTAAARNQPRPRSRSAPATAPPR